MVGTRFRYCAGMIWSVSTLSPRTKTRPRMMALGVFMSGPPVEELARIGDPPGEGRGRDGIGRGEVDLTLLRAHPPREVPVGGGDADLRPVDAAEGIFRTTEAGGARRVERDRAARVLEDREQGAAADRLGADCLRDLRRRGHEERVDRDL